MSCDAFLMYKSLKLHFNNEKYDYFKYHGKMKCPLMPLNQQHIFNKLHKKYAKKLQDFYVANLLQNSYIWVNDLLSEDCYEEYVSYIKRKESLTFGFKCDIIHLKDKSRVFEDLLEIKNDYPFLLKEVFYGNIELETFIVLNSIFNFFDYWDKEIKDEIVWKPFRMKCMKYAPFIRFDVEKMKKLFKSV